MHYYSKRYLLLLCLAFIFVSSCKKEETPAPTPTPAIVTQPTQPAGSNNEDISKKWEISSSSSQRVSQNESEFLWFEFTVDGFFIVLKKDSTTVTGAYIHSGNTITMDGLGTIQISDIKESSFSFTFTPAGSTEAISVFTSEGDQVVQKTTRTNMICKTWKIKRQHGTYMGSSYDYTYPAAGVSEYFAVFSTYGTYVLSMKYTDGSMQVMNRLWKWKDSQETMICYGDYTSDCTGENETSVVNLSETEFTLHSVIPSFSVESYDELVAYK